MSDSQTKIFISYSRTDREAIERLYDRLSTEEALRLFRDTDDILPTEEWKPRLEKLIREADTILFALSPRSAVSEVCAWELGLAESLNKRIIPVVVENVDGQVPDQVSKLNYIFMTPQDNFSSALSRIKDAISLNIDWIREHTRLGELADRWEKSVRLGAQPLRGKELDAAEAWLAEHPKAAPDPTPQQRQYILASRQAATRRQRITVSASLAAMVVVGVLGVFAWVQRGAAIEGERRAVLALETASDAANRMIFDMALNFQTRSVPSDITNQILGEALGLQETLMEELGAGTKTRLNYLRAQKELGDLYADNSELGDAEDTLLTALAEVDLELLEPGEDAARDVLKSQLLISLADYWEDRGKPEKAREYLDRNLAHLTPLLAAYPTDDRLRLREHLLNERLANNAFNTGDMDRAEIFYTKANTYSKARLENDPDDLEAGIDYAISLDKMAKIYRTISPRRLAEEKAAHDAALAIREKLRETAPYETRVLEGLAFSHNGLYLYHVSQRDMQAAAAALQAQAGVARTLQQIDPTNYTYFTYEFVALNDWSDLLAQTGDLAGAEQKSAELASALAAARTRFPSEPNLEMRASAAGVSHAQLLWKLSRQTEAIALLEQAIAADPTPDKEILLVSWQFETGDMASSVAILDRIAVQMEAEGLATSTRVRNFTALLDRSGDYLMRQGDFDGARAKLTRSLKMRKAQLDASPETLEYRSLYGYSLHWMCELERAEATKDTFHSCDTAARLREDLVAAAPDDLQLAHDYFRSQRALWLVAEDAQPNMSLLQGARLYAHIRRASVQFPQEDFFQTIAEQFAPMVTQNKPAFAYFLMRAGEFDLSEEIAKRAIAFPGNHGEVKANLVNVLALNGKQDEALRLYRDNLRTTVLDGLGWAEAVRRSLSELENDGRDVAEWLSVLDAEMSD